MYALLRKLVLTLTGKTYKISIKWKKYTVTMDMQE